MSKPSVPFKGKPYPGLTTTSARDLKVGDYFVDRITLQPWRIVRFDGPTGENPHVVHAKTGADNLFSGAAEPYGPFRTLDDVIAARDIIDASDFRPEPGCTEEWDLLSALVEIGVHVEPHPSTKEPFRYFGAQT